jgi:circadian clock protein KaiB
MKKSRHPAQEQLEAAAQQAETTQYVLRLYVAGTTPRSMNAVENVKRICDVHLAGRYDLEVIDLYERPTLAQGEQIIAAPTLIKKLPEPLRRIIGDMTNEEKLLVGLDLRRRT